jgi:biotin operon repressor
MNGFIKLHRSMLTWEWYGDTITKTVFLHLLLTARFDEGSWKGVKLYPGQIIIGRKELAETLNISERNVRTAINHLKTTGEIAIKVTNKYSLVTLTNWALYQTPNDSKGQQGDQQSANSRPATDQQTTSNRPQRKNIRTEECKDSITTYMVGGNAHPEKMIYFNDAWRTSARARSAVAQNLIDCWEVIKDGSTSLEGIDVNRILCDYLGKGLPPDQIANVLKNCDHPGYLENHLFSEALHRGVVSEDSYLRPVGYDV